MRFFKAPPSLALDLLLSPPTSLALPCFVSHFCPALTLDGDHFYADLVFYHVKLKCYLIIDLKVGKLTHADLGQMQLYVHYYDREITEATDNPTIGLILCTDKNEAVVRYVLDEANHQIFARRYQLHLPSEEMLRQELAREVARLEP